MSNLLFSSGFEGNVALSAPGAYDGRESWQSLTGTDSGFSWSNDVLGGQWTIQMLSGSGTVSGVIQNSIDTVTGHDGNQTRALHLNVLQRPIGDTQDPLLLLPTTSPTDLYTSEWLKLPANLGSKLGGSGGWMSVGEEWKSNGDFRITPGIVVDGSGTPRWSVAWDNNANGGLAPQTFWKSTNAAVAVPQDQWFHIESFTHRSATDGEAWLKVNDQTVFDHTGATIGQNNAPINRIFMGNPYGSTPVDMYVDDVQVHDGVPNPGVAAPSPVTPPTPPVTSPAASATDTLLLSLSEDAWQGDAQFSVAIDGKTIGSPQAVTALHSNGASQDFSFSNALTAGTHDVAISFLNDAYGGTPGTDRNLYVNAINVDSTPVGSAAAALYNAGTHHITVNVPAHS